MQKNGNNKKIIKKVFLKKLASESIIDFVNVLLEKNGIKIKMTNVLIIRRFCLTIFKFVSPWKQEEVSLWKQKKNIVAKILTGDFFVD